MTGQTAAPEPKTWAERIAAARLAGRFTDEDRWEAESWGTCAVGESEARYGMYQLAYDDDGDWEVLEEWGIDFAVAVTKGDFDNADRLRKMIDERIEQISLRDRD